MDPELKPPLIFAGIGLTLILGIALIIGWYKSCLQAEVYRRQGVEMSTWEVFMGSKPVERYIKGKP